MTRTDRARRWATNGFIAGLGVNVLGMLGQMGQGQPVSIIPLMIFFPALIGGILGLLIKSSH